MKYAIVMFLLVCMTPAMAAKKDVPAMSTQAADLLQINCGNLVYAANQTSVCFADAFLTKAAEQTLLNINPSFIRVPLDTAEVYDFPFCVFSGEGTFTLTARQREQLRRYVLGGGFILASPGCSDGEWDRSFRTEMKVVFPDYPMQRIAMDSPVFSMVNTITALHDKKGNPVLVEGVLIDERVVLIYSVEGLNDVSNAEGCCCCGGNQIKESQAANVNILTYALVY